MFLDKLVLIFVITICYYSYAAFSGITKDAITKNIKTNIKISTNIMSRGTARSIVKTLNAEFANAIYEFMTSGLSRSRHLAVKFTSADRIQYTHTKTPQNIHPIYNGTIVFVICKDTHAIDLFTLTWIMVDSLSASGNKIKFAESKYIIPIEYSGKLTMEYLNGLQSKSLQNNRVTKKNVLNKAHYKCAECKQEKECLQCSICKNTYYCSRKCQIANWPYHKEKCSNKPKILS